MLLSAFGLQDLISIADFLPISEKIKRLLSSLLGTNNY